MKIFFILFAITLSTVHCLLFTPSMAEAASLSFSPTTINTTVGQQTTLTLSLDPQGDQVIGTDVILSYDPAFLKIISIVNRQTLPGNPATMINNPPGTTKFSLINPYGVYTTVPGPIADITLEPLKSGSSTLSMKMTPGSTRDTNVAIPGGLDSLTSVNTVTISAAAPAITAQTVTIIVTPTPSPTSTTKLPDLSPSPVTTTIKSKPSMLSPIPEELLAPTATPSATPTSKPYPPVLGLTNTDTTPPTITQARTNYWLFILGLALLAGGITYLILSRRQKASPIYQPSVISDPSSSPAYSYSIPA